MQDWFESQLAAGLPALAGSSVTGTVAVKQELLNDLLSQWLQARTSGRQAPPVDPEQLKRFIKSAAIRAEPGTVLVDFSIAI